MVLGYLLSMPYLKHWILPSTVDGKIYQQSYTLGVADAPLKESGKTDKSGTTIRFKASIKIFTDTNIHFKLLAKRLRELSFLNSGACIILRDERTNDEEVLNTRVV